MILTLDRHSFTACHQGSVSEVWLPYDRKTFPRDPAPTKSWLKLEIAGRLFRKSRHEEMD